MSAKEAECNPNPACNVYEYDVIDELPVEGLKKSDSQLQMPCAETVKRIIGNNYLICPLYHWVSLSLAVLVFFSIYPVYNLLSASDGVQDCGVGDMGLHREQSRGKLPWDQLVVTGCPFHCTVIPSMSYLNCGNYRHKVIWCGCVYFQVFDGAVIVLSLAPMVASTVANGPSSPWDAIGLIITLRMWRVKRIIDGEAERVWARRSLCPVLY